MNISHVRQSDPDVIGVLHRAGPGWCALAASTRQDAPRILDCREFPDDDHGAIRTWLEEQRVEEVIEVLPAAATICRTCSLPVAEAEALDQALDLQAETLLAGSAPSYRVGRAVLHTAPGETSRTGIILAWPASASADHADWGRPTRYASDVAAIAGLLDGERPAEPIVWADRRDGSVSLALTHGNGAVFRATRQELHDATSWADDVGRVLAETGLNVGHTPSFIESIVSDTTASLTGLADDDARLIIPDEIVEEIGRRLDGAGSDPRWWSRFGIVSGIVLVRTSHLETLTRFQLEPPREKPSLVRSVTEAMSSPSTAVKAVVLCLLVLALGPMAFSGLRLKVLQLKYSSIDEELREVEKVRKLQAMYAELGEKRWPVTKLLSDVACCTPVGIEMESVRINQGDTVAVSGIVHPDDKLNLTAQEVGALMQQQMQETRLFTEVTLDISDPTAFGNYQFNLTAKVSRPHRGMKYEVEQDFAAWTLRQRLYDLTPTYELLASGGDAGDTDGAGSDPADAGDAPGGAGTMLVEAPPAVETAADPADIPAPAERGADPVRPSNGPAVDVNRPRPKVPQRRPDLAVGGDLPTRGGGERPSGAPVRGAADDVPEPVTKQQVEAMSRAEAQELLARVAKARNNAKRSGDEALEQRLQDDWALLLERIKSP